MSAPGNDDNAVTHGLFQQCDSLRVNLSEREERILVEIVQDLLDRFPDDAEIGAYERAAIEEIALDTIKRQRANQYILEEDLIVTPPVFSLLFSSFAILLFL